MSLAVFVTVDKILDANISEKKKNCFKKEK